MAGSKRSTREIRVDGSVSKLTVVDAASEVVDVVAEWLAQRHVFVVTSGPIWALHGESTLGRLKRVAKRWTLLEVPDGEAAKTLSVAESLWHRMLEDNGRRDSRVVAFGGGAVCDLGAFAAATYMRGVAFAHVPTTLLAQVDAAIGGKSAINLAGAKNMVGVFRQPDHVVSATDLLATLPARQVRAGLVEAIKVAALCDVELFERIERDLDSLLVDPRASAWPAVVAAAQGAKAAVVASDPREAGGRRVLNFGHTLGHALESASEQNSLVHGEAVAHGMRFALRLALARGLDPAVAERLEAMLARLEIPPLPRVAAEDLLSLMAHDKKARADGVVWVLPQGLGAWEAVTLDPELVRETLDRFLASAGNAC